MSGTPLDGRTFSDREVREILKRAVEQSSSSRAVTRREGLSLDELKAIGSEVGIDPARVESAARAVVLDQGNRSNRLLGGPTLIHVERTVEGALDLELASDVLARIRRVMGRQGEASEIRGALEWSEKGDSGERFVTVSARDGRTTIQASSNLTNAAVLTYLPPSMVGAIVSMVGLIKYVREGSVIGLVLLLTVLPVLYPILRTVFAKIAKGEATKLGHVAEELAQLVESSEADSARE